MLHIVKKLSPAAQRALFAASALALAAGTYFLLR